LCNAQAQHQKDTTRCVQESSIIFVHLVIGAALLEFLYFGFAVGRAREKYGIKAPATTGNEMFERYYRVQVNTLEQLIVFIPSIVLFAWYIEPRVAAVAGAFFVIGRAWYFGQYVRDPRKRTAPFALSLLPVLFLLLGAMGGAVLRLFR
jgi:glutathione S-transferase